MMLRINKMTNRIVGVLCSVLLVTFGFTGCSLGQNSTGTDSSGNDDTTITLFAAKSLNASLDEIIVNYCKENPSVKIQTNYDSSGTLLTQITEGGATCDIFFSAAENQINELERNGFIIDGSREKLLKNKMCIVTFEGSNTEVTGLKDLNKARSLAIAGGSVPIGYYTRKALLNTGIISKNEKDVTSDAALKIYDEKDIASSEISEALGGVEINECQNAGAVVAAIVEHSNEVGTVYYSDIVGFEDEIKIIETVPTEITGEIIYPVAQVKNGEADERVVDQAGRFIIYLKSDEAKDVFRKYGFEVE